MWSPARARPSANSLQRQECIDILTTTLANFEPNLKQIMDRLQQADSDLNVVLMTLYNPFSNKIDVRPVWHPFAEGMPDTPFPEGINDIIRARPRPAA
jgi:hypothetical protein